MSYLAEYEPLMVDPEELVPGARSIICVADRYHDGAADDDVGAAAARVARYARGDDYHRVIKKRLHVLSDELREEHPGESFLACVDTVPIMEREHAQRAGLGAVGKHTLLIEPGVGSYLLLGEVVTTLAIEPTDPAAPDPCGTCTRCIDACPTDAITPWSVDATACLSYLTIEHRSAIDERFHDAHEGWIFGCDVCQEVCPHNQPTRRTAEAPLQDAYEPRNTAFDLLDVLAWSEQDRRDAFIKSAMKRARLDMMKRNALLASAGAIRASTELRARVAAIRDDPSEPELVRETAAAVLGDTMPG